MSILMDFIRRISGRAPKYPPPPKSKVLPVEQREGLVTLFEAACEIGLNILALQRILDRANLQPEFEAHGIKYWRQADIVPIKERVLEESRREHAVREQRRAARRSAEGVRSEAGDAVAP